MGAAPLKTHGIALMLKPTPDFYREKGDEDRRMSFRYLFGYLRPYKAYIVQILTAMLVASIISLILPFITQSVVDTGIGTGNMPFIVMLLIARLILVIGQVLNNLIRSWLMLHMTTRESLPLGYNTKIGADGHGLSTGQKQRVLIARAAYKGAKYLFFDEATNSLDANNEWAIMENLDRLFRNKTVVIVAHRLSTVKNADNIIVLDGGHIVEQGLMRS